MEGPPSIQTKDSLAKFDKGYATYSTYLFDFVVVSTNSKKNNRYNLMSSNFIKTLITIKETHFAKIASLVQLKSHRYKDRVYCYADNLTHLHMHQLLCIFATLFKKLII